RDNAGTGIRAGRGTLVTDSQIISNGGGGLSASSDPVTFRGCHIERVGGATVDGALPLGGNFCDDGRCSRVSRRRYYLTFDPVRGDEATSACDPGFHMASIYELAGLSDFSYDQRGLITLDSGFGPPAGGYALAGGWARTGFGSINLDNCRAWTSSDSLDAAWTYRLTPYPPLSEAWPWEHQAVPCNELRRVWCIQD
nr:hypothetical protein [Myxococcota bacterium]